MPMHWSYKSLPELSALPDAERKAVWKKAVSQSYEQWQTLLASAVVFILMGLLGYWLGSTFEIGFMGVMIGAVLACAITERLVFRIARSHLKNVIARAANG